MRKIGRVSSGALVVLTDVAWMLLVSIMIVASVSALVYGIGYLASKIDHDRFCSKKMVVSDESCNRSCIMWATMSDSYAYNLHVCQRDYCKFIMVCED